MHKIKRFLVLVMRRKELVSLMLGSKEICRPLLLAWLLQCFEVANHIGSVQILWARLVVSQFVLEAIE